jgi:hypothetical protein
MTRKRAEAPEKKKKKEIEVNCALTKYISLNNIYFS